MENLKKDIYRIFIFVIFFIVLVCGNSYGAICQLKKDDGTYDKKKCINLVSYTDRTVVEPSEVLEDLKNKYSYSDDLLNPAILSTKIKVTRKSTDSDTWNVTIGQGSTLTNTYTEEELKSIFGYDPQDSQFKLFVGDNQINSLDNEKSAYWFADIVAEKRIEYKNMPNNYVYVKYDYFYTVREIYTGKDKKGSYDVEQDKENGENSTTTEDTTTGDMIRRAKEFLKHAVESAVTAFCEIIISIGDIFQTIANFIQTGNKNLDVVYPSSKFLEEEKSGESKENLNDYVNYKSEKTTTGDYTIQVPAKDESGESHGFTPDTKIPVISTDVYTLSTNKVDLIKSNFFAKDGTEETIWTAVRNFFSSIIHVFMYVIAAVLLTSLIWHGIGMVRCSIIGSVAEKKKHIDAIHKFEIGCMMLIATLFVEAICLYFTDKVLGDINNTQVNTNKYEGPIRVSVETEVRSDSLLEDDFEDGTETEDGAVAKGYDISHHQGDLNVGKLKEKGASFVILKAGGRYGDDNHLGKDEKFETYYKQAKESGLNIGAYWYCIAMSTSQSKADANYMYEHCLKGKDFQYPIYLDVEENALLSKGKDDVTDIITTFCDTLKDKGYVVGVYASESYFSSYMHLDKVKQYELWVANWSKKPTSVASYGIWQYTRDETVVINDGGKNKEYTLDGDKAYKEYSNSSNGNSGTSTPTLPGELTGDVIDYEYYSFSTTPTGYIRYMSNISNIYLYGKKALFSFAYIILAFTNMISMFAMVMRMVLMMILAIVGFSIIFIFVFKSKEASTKGYLAWIKIYAGLSLVQIGFAVIARLLIEVIFVG